MLEHNYLIAEICENSDSPIADICWFSLLASLCVLTCIHTYKTQDTTLRLICFFTLFRLRLACSVSFTGRGAAAEHTSLRRMVCKEKPLAEIGFVAQQHSGRFRSQVTMGKATTCGPSWPTKELAIAYLNAAREGATSREDFAQSLRALVAAAAPPPPQKPHAERGGVQQRCGRCSSLRHSRQHPANRPDTTNKRAGNCIFECGVRGRNLSGRHHAKPESIG